MLYLANFAGDWQSSVISWHPIHEEDAICWYSPLMAASANRLRAMISLSLLVRTCEYGSLGLWAVVLHILYHCLEIFIDITDLKLPDYRRIVWHFQVNCEHMLGCLQVQSVHCTDNNTFSSRTTDPSCNASLSLTLFGEFWSLFLRAQAIIAMVQATSLPLFF